MPVKYILSKGVFMLSMLDSAARESVHSHASHRRGTRESVKRSLDVSIAFLSLLFLFPVIAVICILLLVHDGRPLIYRHKRVGRDGKIFDCLKFRTMRRDAEMVLNDLLSTSEAARCEWNTQQKLRQDPRIHRLGRFLRMASLDEIPQFINVLRGEMSIVGPRPIVEDEIPRYGDRIHCYLSMTPGITGLWQVSGRSDTSYDYRVDLDAEYHRTHSLGLDLRIMWRTVGVLLFERNGC
ncbi:sugar transferase [Chelativorans salis]|uniref:Sugar transferase n=1 Tax=Chelativorans salis TaxID=2978478 RepID=A0ABT2LMF9_9HYPH|nr:sugar transferase [Chelativorans sp. EGI FJ00035]MCT7375579.1 sugar transferase [Chelativorans sp. EGI FJ00035]